MPKDDLVRTVIQPARSSRRMMAAKAPICGRYFHTKRGNTCVVVAFDKISSARVAGGVRAQPLHGTTFIESVEETAAPGAERRHFGGPNATLCSLPVHLLAGKSPGSLRVAATFA